VKAADVSTAGANEVSDEARSEALDRSQSGLSGSARLVRESEFTQFCTVLLRHHLLEYASCP